jgi:cobyrinic acid a,c-diamide synthase
LKSRHLGLVPSVEVKELKEKVEKITDMMEKTIDIDGIIEIAGKAGNIHCQKPEKIKKINEKVKIGVAYDKAFNFYYQDNLELLEELGAELVKFSPIFDEKLPDNLDGLYLGGGFPEIFADKLSKNKKMMEDIRKFTDENNPVYAECGGLMYMCKSIVDLDGNSYDMVGILDNTTTMTKRLQRFGYVDVSINEDTILSSGSIKFRAHEFHRSKIDYLESDNLKYEIEKNRFGRETLNWKCGYSYKNFLGGYAHVHFYNNLDVPLNFLNSCINKEMR